MDQCPFLTITCWRKAASTPKNPETFTVSLSESPLMTTFLPLTVAPSRGERIVGPSNVVVVPACARATRRTKPVTKECRSVFMLTLLDGCPGARGRTVRDFGGSNAGSLQAATSIGRPRGSELLGQIQLSLQEQEDAILVRCDDVELAVPIQILHDELRADARVLVDDVPFPTEAGR